MRKDAESTKNNNKWMPLRLAHALPKAIPIELLKDTFNLSIVVTRFVLISYFGLFAVPIVSFVSIKKQRQLTQKKLVPQASNTKYLI